MRFSRDSWNREPAGERKAGAFTIIEIMVAIGILGLILTAIYSSWTAILKGAATGNRAAAVAQRERMARRVVEDALNSVLYFTENYSHYAFVADTTDERFASLSLVARLPESFPGSAMFPDHGPRRVTFQVRMGEKGQNEFVMSQTELLIPTNIVEEPFTLKLADNISLFRLEFWDTNVQDWAVEWLETNQLPQVVRVGLSFGVPGQVAKPEDVVSTVVALPAVAVTREIQIPDGQGAGGRRPGVRPGPGNPGDLSGQGGGGQGDGQGGQFGGGQRGGLGGQSGQFGGGQFGGQGAGRGVNPGMQPRPGVPQPRR